MCIWLLMAENWSKLSKALLNKIEEKLDSHSDYIRFRSVCVGWRRSTKPQNLKALHDGYPCLVLPNHPMQTHHSFLSLFDNKVYQLELPDVRDKLFRGCSHDGWIVAIGKGPSIYLIHPLLKNQLQQLPPITTFPDVLEYLLERVGEEYVINFAKECRMPTRKSSAWVCENFIQKVAFSPSLGTTTNYMAIYGESSRLAVCKHGDKQWSTVGLTSNGIFSDIMFYRDQFFVVDQDGAVYTVCDLDSSPILVQRVPPPRGLGSPTKVYLVDSLGDLLVVGRDIVNHDGCYKTVDFKIFKLNVEISDFAWEAWWSKKEKSLGDRALFLGSNHSFCLSARDFPGCDRNCIYFIYDYYGIQDASKVEVADLGVFNYNTKVVYQIY